jgi:hypothetical protein
VCVSPRDDVNVYSTSHGSSGRHLNLEIVPPPPNATQTSFCGSLCCADCTRFRLGAQQKRACMLCHLAVQRARREYEENGGDADTNGGLPSSQQTSPRNGAMGMGADYGVDMTERMLTLESRLGHIERQRRVRKARTLLQCADWVVGAQTLSLVLAGGLLGHYAAVFAGMRGWDARAMAWLQQALLPPPTGGAALQQAAAWSFLDISSSSSSSRSALVAPFLQWLGGVEAYWVIWACGVLGAVVVASSTLYRRSVTAFSVVRG